MSVVKAVSDASLASSMLHSHTATLPPTQSPLLPSHNMQKHSPDENLQTLIQSPENQQLTMLPPMSTSVANDHYLTLRQVKVTEKVRLSSRGQRNFAKKSNKTTTNNMVLYLMLSPFKIGSSHVFTPSDGQYL